MSATTEAKSLIADKSYTPVFGARPVKRYLQKFIETQIGKLIISGELRDGHKVIIDADGEELKLTAQ